MNLKPTKSFASVEHPAGRRRDSSKHQAILKATRELIEENGYKGLSVSAIASRAKVTRNVLYNWWEGDINRIVEEALLPNPRQWEAPNTGTFKNDIDAFLDIIIDVIHKPNVLKGFLAIAAEIAGGNSELSQTVRYFRAPYVQLVAKIIKNAEARNEITQGLNANHVAQIISGSVMQFAISKQAGRRKAKTILSELIVKLAAK